MTRLWWAGPAAGLLLLMMLATLLGGREDPLDRGTSYDAGATGFRALYLLLEELRVPVERARRPAGGAVRWVLAPTDEKTEALASWVREGGRMLLATKSREFARTIGLDVEVRTDADTDGDEPVDELAGDIAVLAGGATVVAGPAGGRPWLTAGGEPFVTIHPMGAGEVWLLNRPDTLSNRLLPRADNAVLACRLAAAMRAESGDAIAFDEYVHGLRDRPGMVALLLRPPALWVTLQGLLATAVLLWHHAPRFGSLRPEPPARRRSVAEFLDAQAALLERRGDTEDALRSAREALRRDLEQALGLPAGVDPEALAREAARRRGLDAAHLLGLLTAPPGGGRAAFLKSLNELETVHHEFFRAGARR